MDVIIDKSYLDGATTDDVTRLCEAHRGMMSETLFYELVTATDGSRQRCFSKLPETENPLVLVPGIGTLITYENDHRASSVPIYERRLNLNFIFNKGLRTGEFQFTDEQKLHRDEEINRIQEETSSFIERVKAMKEMFSELAHCQRKDIAEVASKLQFEVVNNPELVKEVYAGTVGQANVPINVPPEQIGEEWIIYRWVQSQLMYGLDLHVKYQGEIPKDAGENFSRNAEHDMLDAHYVVLGVLCGGIATKDKNIGAMFKMMNPKGVVLP